MRDLERDLNTIQVFSADFGARCVRIDKIGVFSVHTRSIFDLNSILIEIHSGIARFTL